MQDCEKVCDANDQRLLRLHIGLGWAYQERHCYFEARDQGRIVSSQAQYNPNKEVSASLRRDAYQLLASAQKSLGDIDGAVTCFKEYLCLIILQDGAHSGTRIRGLLTLESWYSEWGMPEEASQVKAERMALQFSMLELV